MVSTVTVPVANYGRIQMAVINWRVDRLVFYVSNLISLCEFTARTGKTIAKYILFLPVFY
jgi:hypothetical protein